MPKTNGQLVGSDTPLIILNLYNQQKQWLLTKTFSRYKVHKASMNLKEAVSAF